jgi:hypothetical protein
MKWAPLGLFALGCAGPEDGHLSRLTRAWAAETAQLASPAVTATSLASALSASLCVSSAEDGPASLQVGDSLPLMPALDAALGSPVIEAISTESGLSMVLSGVRLLDREDQWLRISASEDAGQFSVELDALVDDGSDTVEVAKLVAFGQLRLEVRPDCAETQSLVRGKALWIDTQDRRHDVQLPADSELGGDLSVGGDIPYLPSAGALGWSAKIEGQERSITTEDAGEIRVDTPDDEVPMARWPVVARGPGWSGTALTEIAP